MASTALTQQQVNAMSVKELTMSKYETKGVPNPGSEKAVKNGCTCAILDNHRGAGFGNPPQFWITEGCPLHDKGLKK